MSEQGKGFSIGKALCVVLLMGGGWLFLRKYEIHGLDLVQVKPRGTAGVGAGVHGDGDPLDAYFGAPATPAATHGWAPNTSVSTGTPATLASSRSPSSSAPAAGDADPLLGISGTVAPIRVGSWALAGFGREKLAKPHVMDWFSRIVRQFDVVALQQITAKERDLLPRIVEHVNRSGRRYDFLLGPVVGPEGDAAQTLGEQYAFLFDTERVETDRSQLYTLEDPGHQLSYDPLVGWFRALGVPSDRAWTFTLVNFRVDSLRAEAEVPLLGKMMEAIASDGRGEDDLLLAGMLHADDQLLEKCLGSSLIQPVVRATPTDIFARYQLSNLVSPALTTTEYLGRGGVVDFLRLYNLSIGQSEELSPHLPVYGEFAPVEGL